jgi:hypothetical protein
MVTIGTVSIARWKNADRMWWQAIVAFAIRTRTSLLVPQKAGAQRNAAFASGSSVVKRVAAAVAEGAQVVAILHSSLSGSKIKDPLRQAAS